MEKFVKASDVLEFLKETLKRKQCIKKSFEEPYNEKMVEAYSHECEAIIMLIMDFEEMMQQA